MNGILLGAVSLDVYRETGLILPGGGCLNVAYHWQGLEVPFLFLTRIGGDHPALILDFLDRHEIAYLPDSIITKGPSASIDIAISPDGQPVMNHFMAGVWADFRLAAIEESYLPQASFIHTVLVEGMITEINRLGKAGALAKPMVTADFLDFRHFTVTRFAQMIPYVDIAFVGWPGQREDNVLQEMGQLILAQNKLMVATLGAKGALVFDGRSAGERAERFFPTTAVPVRGTAVGCGDTFIAYFLAEFLRSGDIAQAIARGQLGGALATTWLRPLPDEAYQS